MKKGLFIVFEGIDGSGTTTQTTRLNSYLNSNGNKSVLTCEPSNGSIGNMLRQIFKGRFTISKGDNPYVIGGNLYDEQIAYLFAADRHDHLFNPVDGVVKHLNDGKHVICSRYYFSSFAYQCSSVEDFGLISDLNSRFPTPDIVFYLDNPVEVSIDRMRGREFLDEYENATKLEQAKINYDKVFAAYKGKVIRINATNTENVIYSDIVAHVNEFLLKG